METLPLPSNASTAIHELSELTATPAPKAPMGVWSLGVSSCTCTQSAAAPRRAAARTGRRGTRARGIPLDSEFVKEGILADASDEVLLFAG